MYAYSLHQFKIHIICMLNNVVHVLFLFVCLFFCILLYNRLIGLVGSVRQWFGRPGFNPRSSYTKDFKNGS